MILREQQALFIKLLAQLISWAYQNGYELTAGELKRSNEQAIINAMGYTKRMVLANAIALSFPDLSKAILDNGKANGIVGSLHELGLAVDLNLFKDGKFLPNSEDHRPLGEYWKSLSPLCRWGGDFKPNPDGNHYSCTWGGKS